MRTFTKPSCVSLLGFLLIYIFSALTIGAALLLCQPFVASELSNDVPDGGVISFKTYAAETTADLQRRYVMIGDSYAKVRPKHNLTPWPELVASKLGLALEDVTIIRSPGYGFAKPGHRFQTLIARQPGDEAVTDVLIVGGIGNDRDSRIASIKKYYKKTIKLIKKKYPNARIMHAIVNWRPTNKRYQKIVSSRIPQYRMLAKKCGVIYLKGCESVLKGHPEWFLDDKVHPNRLGSIAIANRIVKRMNAIVG